MKTEEERENVLYEAANAFGSELKRTFFLENYTEENTQRDASKEFVVLEILHCALELAEYAVRNMKEMDFLRQQSSE